MLRNISIRYKFMLLAALLVGLTGILAAVYASWLAFENAKEDLRAKGKADAHLFQHVLLEPLRLDDTFQTYELLSAPFKARLEKSTENGNPARSYLVEMALLDDEGRVLSSSDPRIIPIDSMYSTDEAEFLSAAPQLATIVEDTPSTLLTVDEGKKFFVISPVGENGVKYANLVQEYSLEALLADAIHRVAKIALVIALITILMMALAWVIAKRFTGPLLQLSQDMRRLANRHGFTLGGDDDKDETHQLRVVFDDLEKALEVAERENCITKEKMLHQAEHDSLTGLPNRALVKDRLEQAVARAVRNHEQLAVMFLDLDHFKRVNDLLGHHAGDQLLQMVSHRLLGTVRVNDTVSRLGGDEFLLMLSPIHNESEARMVAEKLIQAISAPYMLDDGTEINTSVSIGISLFPSGGRTPGELTKSADEAMYRAKELGRNNYQIFTQDMHGEAFERASLESQLRQAIRQRQFLLHYQPQLELSSDRINGLEALIRWQHPTRGLVYPGDFIQVAEETGLILEIGEWVIEEACRQMREWMDAGKDIPTIAVNVSFKQFHLRDLQNTIEAALRRYELPGNRLEIELTESVMLRDPTRVLEILQNLRAQGVRISIDDFGTGYSSLLYLKQLNIDALKIDRSFVMDIADPQGLAMVKVIRDVALTLGLRTIAEGVETAAQLQALRAIGCDEIQGYYFSRPLSATDILLFLQAHTEK